VIPTSEATTFSLTVDTYIQTTSSFNATVSIELPQLSVQASTTLYLTAGQENKLTVSVPMIASVQLWWPRGYGGQPLYQLNVTLSDAEGNVLDSRSQLIGFRSVELITAAIPGQNGSSMYFQINGLPVFAKGANWIPAGTLPINPSFCRTSP